MTLSPLHVYIWGQLDSIHKYLEGIAALGFSVGIICIVAYVMFKYICELEITATKIAPWILIPLGFLATTLDAVVPAKNTFAAMIIAPAIVNSEPIQKDMPELYRMGVEKLKEAMATKKEEKK